MPFQNRRSGWIALSLLASLRIGASAHAQGNPGPTAEIPPPNPNGYDMLVAASRQFKEAEDGAPDLLRFNAKPTDAPLKERQRFLNRRAAALNFARAAIKTPYRNPSVRSASAVFPELAGFRELARAFALEAETYDEKGNTPKAASSYLDAMEMGTQIPRGGVIIHKLVGISCESIGRKGLWDKVQKLDAAAIRPVIRRLEILNANRLPLVETLQEEKLASVASAQESLSERMAEAEKAPPPPAPPELPDGRVIEAEPPPPPLTEARIEDLLQRQAVYYDALIAAAQRPFRERAERTVNAFYAEGAGKLPPGDDRIPVSLMLIAEDLRLKEESVKSENALLITALALRAYHADKGDYPADLTNLVKGEKKYLARLLADPFASDGKSVRYRRVSADRYLLYSVGPDGYDDNGKPFYTPSGQEKTRLEEQGKPNRTVGKDLLGDIVVGINVGPDSLAPAPAPPPVPTPAQGEKQ